MAALRAMRKSGSSVGATCGFRWIQAFCSMGKPTTWKPSRSSKVRTVAMGWAVMMSRSPPSNCSTWVTASGMILISIRS